MTPAAHPDTALMASTPDKMRRPGYAPAENVGVGRRGLHTRDRIRACAAQVFLTNGFHATSLDTIAKAANTSRATVYQYFANKEDIFRELSTAAARDVLAHGERLGGLGPTRDGTQALHRWLAEWADIYDVHAAAFAEYPGIGTDMSVIDVGPVAESYRSMVVERLRTVDLSGLHVDDAAAALGRIPHMVSLFRHRGMFPLPNRSVVSSALTIALQLMLFPETPPDALASMAAPVAVAPAGRASAGGEPTGTAAAVDDAALSPIAHDVLAVSSTLFAERGYYAVSMEDIAVAAGLGRATLYRYFSAKDKILAELTRRAAAEIEAHAAALAPMAADALTEWMLRYVRFHRTYRGVIRAWFDGTVAEQLSDADVDHGVGAIRHAIVALLDTVDLPPGMERDVAAAVFMAVLGRMTEPTRPDGPADDELAATLMVNLLRRSLLRAESAQAGDAP